MAATIRALVLHLTGLSFWFIQQLRCGALAKSLSESDNAEVIVLEAIFFFYQAVGAPRAYVDGDYTNKMFIPYDNAIPKHATKFDDKESETTEKLKFDYLVLATGSTYSVPIKPDSRDYARSATEAKLQEVRDHIKKAEKVLVVGGGAVGCEVAAEIKAKYPSKLVTIVDANKQLISGNNLRDKFYAYLNASLEKLDVRVILGERLTERLSGNGLEKRTLRTDKGTAIESDIQLLCGGFSPVATLVQEMAVWAGEEAPFLAGELAAVLRKKQTGFTKERRLKR
ncbi:hypothetical protein PC122_g20762 [Phytophthora cactorum]|nr:hypothetical protein PC122_g20762 [Phytophthora cactorum]